MCEGPLWERRIGKEKKQEPKKHVFVKIPTKTPFPPFPQPTLSSPISISPLGFCSAPSRRGLQKGLVSALLYQGLAILSFFFFLSLPSFIIIIIIIFFFHYVPIFFPFFLSLSSFFLSFFPLSLFLSFFLSPGIRPRCWRHTWTGSAF